MHGYVLMQKVAQRWEGGGEAEPEQKGPGREGAAASLPSAVGGSREDPKSWAKTTRSP